MHTPGHNPFITQQPFQFNVNPYSEGFPTLPQQNILNPIFAQLGIGNAGSPEALEVLKNIGLATEDFLSTEGTEYGTPYFSYQGISPEIFGALQNVFNLGEGEEVDVDISEILGSEGLEDNLFPFVTEQVFGSESDAPLTYENFATLLNYAGDIKPQLLDTVNVFDPESIATTLSEISNGNIQAEEIKALTPEQLEKTTAEYYDPLEDTQRQSLVERLAKATGQAATGGFAGSGARQAGLSGAERLYRGGYQDLLSDIMKMRAGATEDVLDTIYGYQELLSGVSGQ